MSLGEIFFWGKRPFIPSLVFTDKTVTLKTYKTKNDYNGIAINIDAKLGDCIDTDLDNVLEQFKGSIGAYISAALTYSLNWSSRGGTENLPLLQLICNEIAWQYKRTKQLFSGYPIIENNISDNLPSVDLLGTYQDSLNKIDGENRLFVFSQGSFKVCDREWSIDISELIPPAAPYVPPIVYYQGYGALYNWYAVNCGKLCPIGWHVPTKSEFENLITAVGGYYVGGDNLKSIGYTFWKEYSNGSDYYGFNAKGAGIRDILSGVFKLLKERLCLWSSTSDEPGETWQLNLNYDNSGIGLQGSTDEVSKTYGNSVRCVKDSTTLSIGETGTVPDIDGNVYPTICIGGLEIMASNLTVEHYNDGTSISHITNDASWAAATGGAYCYYDGNAPYLSIDYVSCRFHWNDIPYDTNSFTVTHSGSYTAAWQTGTHFDYSQVGDKFTVTMIGTNTSGHPYSDNLVITQGSLTVSFGVVQMSSPN